MLSETIQQAMNQHIGDEFGSSYLYLAMAAWCEQHTLHGFGHWLRIRSQEETTHGLRLFDLLLDRGGRVLLPAITAPPSEFGSVLELMQQAQQREQQVSASFGELYELVRREGDHLTEPQLQWFLNEQVEEEKSVTTIVDELKLSGLEGAALLLLDRELAVRRAKPAPTEAQATE
jgi:ferritin